MSSRSVGGDATAIAPDASTQRVEQEVLRVNRLFYDPLWADTRLVDPERFNTWPLVQTLIVCAPRRLEVAPGLRPRLPLADTQFIDISGTAVQKLRHRGASVAIGSVTALPFAAASFDLVCSLDIIEHVDDDERALSELARVCAPGGVLLLSAPLHPTRWSAFDELVGHRRRYDPASLFASLTRHGLTVMRSAVFGMRPRSSRLTGLGMWWLTHQRDWAIWWYNHVLTPLALHFKKELVLHEGIVDARYADELLLVCRKADD